MSEVAAGDLSFEVLESTVDPKEQCLVRSKVIDDESYLHGLDLINFLQRIALNLGVAAYKLKSVEGSDVDITVLEGNINTLNAVSRQLSELVFRDNA